MLNARLFGGNDVIQIHQDFKSHSENVLNVAHVGKDRAMQYAILFKNAPELLAAIQKALYISDLWRPPQGKDDVSEEFRDELEAIESMYQNFKNIVNTVTSK